MLRNYFVVAWRNLRKGRMHSAINILGLAIGMGVTLLIGLWVYNEYTYDRFLPDYNQLYRVQRNFSSNGDTLTFRTTSLKLAETLRRQIPEIEGVAESDWMGSHGLIVGDKKFFIAGARIGDDFLKMFKYRLIKGDRNTVMKDAYSIILTASTAKALFGDEDPINKMVRFENEHDLKVTGVLDDLPANSTLQFNYLIPFSYLYQTSDRVRNQQTVSFGNNSFQIFVRLKPGVSYAQVAPKIKNIEHVEKDNFNAINSFVTLQPITRWHLYNNYVNGQDKPGFLEYVKIFTLIGLLVLLIACINFVNLATARSEKRAREVGVRKAVGSGRSDLIFQFLVESLLTTVCAFILALGLVQLALPAFNTLTAGKLSIPYGEPIFWLILLAAIMFTTLLAGSRPAFYLSSFNPVKVLKGSISTGNHSSWPRKILVVAQFTCSVALISGTIIIYQQIQHARTRPTGYNLDRLMVTELRDDLIKNYPAVKNELIEKGIAASVTTATSPATEIYWHSGIRKWLGKYPNENIEMGTIIVGEDYFKTLGMQLAEGNNFKDGNDTTSVILNETAVRQMRLKNPVNQLITWGDQQLRIIGIVKDALMTTPFAGAEPTMFLCDGKPDGTIMYRLNPSIATETAVTQLTAIFNKYNPAYPFIFNFADQNYAVKYKQEVLIGKLAGLFAGLALFISCLGLLGLASYVAEQRSREIGIRKVLGATVSQLWLLLSRDFLLLVAISCLIATPLAVYFLKGWLQKYDYRISMGPGVFLVSSLAALFITIVTISFQAIKAAIANPVKSLRSE